ncbi:hypothetical protein NDU88_002102 [Pleurodeles waltl]|uniref:Secreted protein n=1 Tax=Pleurodeles waltl TaxID=8319 RepID=A0AAV7NEE9_PLEWA|nr:hypothetical protein NDU88_002102 [Pleurodeles waltl]
MTTTGYWVLEASLLLCIYQVALSCLEAPLWQGPRESLRSWAIESLPGCLCLPHTCLVPLEAVESPCLMVVPRRALLHILACGGDACRALPALPTADAGVYGPLRARPTRHSAGIAMRLT